MLCFAGHNAAGSGVKLWVAAIMALGLGGPLRSEEITVFAASSLKTALDQVAADWQVATGHSAAISYDGSAKLAKQIEQGAPADVFVSAAQEWMDVLVASGLIRPETRRNILGNRLVLVGQTGAQPVAIGPSLDLAALLDGGLLAMGMTNSVPAGQYGYEALVSLGLWDSVAGRVVETENVRAAVKLVALGEARAGIVFASDAVAETGIAVLGTFPEASHAPITYPAAVTKGAGAAAQDFVAYLSSPEARARFRAQGFLVLP